MVQKGKVLENKEIQRHKVLRRVGVVGNCDYKTIDFVLIYNKFICYFEFFTTKHGILLYFDSCS
jgi:hypothetical protein